MERLVPDAIVVVEGRALVVPELLDLLGLGAHALQALLLFLGEALAACVWQCRWRGGGAISRPTLSTRRATQLSLLDGVEGVTGAIEQMKF